MGSRLLRLVAGLALAAAASAAAAQSMQPANDAGRQTAIFAGGCFWCMEHPFDEIDGVVSVTSGYSGGSKQNPTYEEVSSGTTGHAEAVQVVYDPAKVSYQKLVDVFWHNIDPLAANAQFCDHGTQYRSAIFYQGDEQKRVAEADRDADRRRLDLLAGRGLSPALLQDQFGQVQVLPLQLRPRSAARAIVGQAELVGDER